MCVPHPRRLAARVDVVAAGLERGFGDDRAVVDARADRVADDGRAVEQRRERVDLVRDLDDLVVGGADARHVREDILDLRAVPARGDERDVVLAQELDDQPGREAARAVDDDRACRSWRRSVQPEQAHGVLLEDQRAHLRLDVELVEVGEPAIRRDERIVGAEQHPVAQQRVGVLDQLRREVLRRPAGQVDVDLRLVHRHRERLVLPRERGVREHDLERREVDRDVVDVDRIRVLEADAAAAGQARADARLPGVEERGQPRLLDHLVERVGHAVVREEALDVGVELEAAHPVVGDQAPRLVDAAPALVRVDARERDEHVGVRVGDRGDLLVGHARLPRERLRVDREDDGHHLPLAVVDAPARRRRPRRLAAEVAHGGLAQVVGEGVAAGLRHLDVRVEVDRDDVLAAGGAQPRRPSGDGASSANASSAVGSSSASRLATASGATPSRMRLTGISSFLPVSVRGIARTCSIVSGTWRGESSERRLRPIRCAQSVVEHGAVGEHDEEQQLARPSLVVLQMHHEAVDDLRQLLDDAVELARAEPDAAAVERGVGAPGEDAAAALGELDPVALAPDPREHVEVRAVVERAVGVAPELRRHGRHRPRDHELAEPAHERLALRVVGRGRDAQQPSRDLALVDRQQRRAAHDAAADVGAAAAVEQHARRGRAARRRSGSPRPGAASRRRPGSAPS